MVIAIAMLISAEILGDLDCGLLVIEGLLVVILDGILAVFINATCIWVEEGKILFKAFHKITKEDLNNIKKITFLHVANIFFNECRLIVIFV